MRWLLIFILFIIVALAGVYGAGSALPETMVTLRGAQFKAPVGEVWNLVTNYPEMPNWNDGIAKVTPIPGEDKTTLWDIEDNDGRHMVLKVVHSEQYHLHHSEIIANDQPFKGSWKFELTANDGGTWLKLEEHSRISNPFLRFVTYYILGSDYGIRTFLQALGRHLVQDVEIKELAA